MLFDQFFSRYTVHAVLGFVAVTLLAVLCWAVPVLALPALIVLTGVTLYATYRSLEYGLLIAFFEIIIGGHGRLISADLFGFSLSLRMAIFGAVMLGFFYGWYRHVYAPKWILSRDSGFILLLVAVGIGSIVGFLRNDPLSAFDDANSYSVLLYALPFSALAVTQQVKRRFLQVLVLGALILSFSSILLSYAFTHLDGDFLDIVYRFVRDSRLYEVTLQLVHETPAGRFEALVAMFFPVQTYWYRIFGASQFYSVVMLLLLTALGFFAYVKQRTPSLFYVFFGTVAFAFLLAMSRSFLIGLGVAGLALLGIALFSARRTSAFLRIGPFVLAGAGAILAIVISVQIPLPPNPPIEEAAFYSTSKDTVRSMAVASRWQMLDPLLAEIKKSPLIGAGFGKTITYQSSDPRVIAETGGGLYTTYRFEWGYLDLLLKMGVLGIIAFLVYAWYFVKAGLYTAKKHGYDWIVYGLLASVLSLFVINVFTPYLNHPVGLYFLLVAPLFFDYEGFELTRNAKLAPQPANVVDRRHRLFARWLKG